MSFGKEFENNDKVVDIKDYIDKNRESLEENNKLIEDLKAAEAEVGPIPDNVLNENSENMEKVAMNVIVDPNTGEHKIIGRANDDEAAFAKSFEGIIKRINEGDPDILSAKPFTESEIINHLKSVDDETLVKELDFNTDMSPQAVRDLLDIINRRINGEKFNIYKESPKEVRDMVDVYIGSSKGQIKIYNNQSLNAARNKIAESLIDAYIFRLKSDRAKTDFAKELENIYSYNCSSAAAAAAIEGIELIDERNKAYRELANDIEDEGKRNRLNQILDRIEEARSLTELKEFAKTCKIKRIEIEKPHSRVYERFLDKYRDSVNNIYDINIAVKVLNRVMVKCTPNDITALLVCFCKQCTKYSPDNVLEHAYMYYFLYNCVMMDGDKSDTFKNNIMEVIANIHERNK